MNHGEGYCREKHGLQKEKEEREERQPGVRRKKERAGLGSNEQGEGEERQGEEAGIPGPGAP